MVGLTLGPSLVTPANPVFQLTSKGAAVLQTLPPLAAPRLGGQCVRSPLSSTLGSAARGREGAGHGLGRPSRVSQQASLALAFCRQLSFSFKWARHLHSPVGEAGTCPDPA